MLQRLKVVDGGHTSRDRFVSDRTSMPARNVMVIRDGCIGSRCSVGYFTRSTDIRDQDYFKFDHICERDGYQNCTFFRKLIGRNLKKIH